MDLDEESAKKRKNFEIGQDLAEMSVEELSETIEMLNDEITRLEQAKSEKSDHLSAAEALFAPKS